MLRPGRAELTVVVTARAGDRSLSPTLAALAGQTAASDRFEALIVSATEPRQTAGDGSALRAAGLMRPDLELRVVWSPGSGEGALRNVALAAVATPYVTFLRAGDTASPRFVEALLAAGDPDIVAAAPIGPRPPTPAGASGLVDPAHEPDVLTGADGRAFTTGVAREVGFAGHLDAGLERDFSVRYWLRRDVRVAPIASGDAAVVRPEPRGRLLAELNEWTAVTDHVAALVDLGQLLDTLTRDEADGVVRYHQRAVGTMINRYLRVHPGVHGAVLDELRTAGARHVLYPAINAGLARELVVSFCFPPVVDTSGVVMAKRVQQRGEIVDVLSNNANTARVTFDHGAERIAEEYVADHMPVKATRIFTRSWPAVVEFVERGLGAARARQAQYGPYRSVRSRAMWVAAHPLAALMRARQDGLHWSAEMSDPLSRDVHGELREAPLPPGDPLVIELHGAARAAGFPVPTVDHLGVFVELLTYALADEIVFTNVHQRDYMLGYCEVPRLAERARSVSVIRPQPTLPPRFYRLGTAAVSIPADRVNLAYFGNLYANRALEDVVHALGQLTAELRSEVRLSVFTATPDFVTEQVTSRGLADVIDVRPYLPYLDFLGVLDRFDCLVIEDARTAGTGHDINPYLPSKWADYRGSGTPVWGIVEPGSPLSDEAPAYRSKGGDRASAAATLRQIISDATARRRGQPVGAPPPK